MTDLIALASHGIGSQSVNDTVIWSSDDEQIAKLKAEIAGLEAELK